MKTDKKKYESLIDIEIKIRKSNEWLIKSFHTEREWFHSNGDTGASELVSSQRHAESTATHRTIPSERNPETS